MLQGQRDLATVSSMILSELAPLVSAQHGVFYSMTSPSDGGEPVLAVPGRLRLRGAQASLDDLPDRRGPGRAVREGEEAHPAHRGPRRLREDQLRPRRRRLRSTSSCSRSSSRARFAPWSSWPHSHPSARPTKRSSISSPRASASCSTRSRPTPSPRTCSKQSQSQAEELRSQQEELRESNEDLERQAKAASRAEHRGRAEEPGGGAVQAPGRGEGRPARRLLEVQVGVHRQHVARAPHSAQQPADPRRAARGQPGQQHERRPRSSTRASSSRSGKDLLHLLNSILELAKVESGTVAVEMAEVSVERAAHRPASASSSRSPRARGSATRSTSHPTCPRAIVTDPQRLRQILKNLLVNAFKFTERGEVEVQRRCWPPAGGAARRAVARSSAESVMAIAVSDTGIGIDKEQQRRIFEAFAQGDGTTARLYGAPASASRSAASWSACSAARSP